MGSSPVSQPSPNAWLTEDVIVTRNSDGGTTGWDLDDAKALAQQVTECFATLEDNDAAISDPVNHPQHYTSHPSGVECIQITEHMGFNLGNAIKYIWRADLKGQSVEDLQKARWYIEREIGRREKG